MDAATHATIAFVLTAAQQQGGSPFLPFALETLEIKAPCTQEMWCWVIRSESGSAQKLDIHLLDQHGNLCVRLQGFSSRAVETRHPLLQQDRSSTKQVRFTTTFKGSESYLRDHGQMLPGAVFLEMARAAGVEAGGCVGLRNVIWSKPLVITEPGRDVQLDVSDDRNSFQISTEQEGVEAVHCQGRYFKGDVPPVGSVDIADVRARCTNREDKAAINKLLENGHGASIQSVVQLDYNDREALAEIELPIEADRQSYTLHPSIINGAVLTGVLLARLHTPEHGLAMPYGLDELIIHGEIKDVARAYVRLIESSEQLKKVDIDLIDRAGVIVVAFKGLIMLATPSNSELTYAITRWQPLQLMIMNQAHSPNAMNTVTTNQAHSPNAMNTVTTNQAHSPKAPIIVTTTEALHAELMNVNANAMIELIKVMEADDATAIEGQLLKMLQLVQDAVLNLSKGDQPICLLIPEAEQQPAHAALVSFLRTAHLEHAGILPKVVYYQSGETADVQNLLTLLDDELQDSNQELEIRYNQGVREVRRLEEIAVTPQEAPCLKPGDLVWITGGQGGLGLIFAEHFASVKDVTLVLSGRSPLRDPAVLEKLRSKGAEAVYLQGDIGKEADVQRIVDTILRDYGKLTGIIHSAGVVRDAFILNKTPEDVAQVLQPKIAGVLALEKATQALDLEFMMLFSSLSSVMGNPGQADYAAANGFLNGFAEARYRQQSSCKVMSIIWPLWQSGGMQMDEANQIKMTEATGMVPMEAQAGQQALDAIFGLDHSQILVFQGEAQKIRSVILEPESQTQQAKQESKTVSSDQKHLRNAAFKELVHQVSDLMGVAPKLIEADSEFSAYGFDSITFLEFTNRLNAEYGLDLMPTLFFEYTSLTALADYLVSQHEAALLNKYGAVVATQPTLAKPEAAVIPKQVTSPVQIVTAAKSESAIAIVGMHGRFPGSPDLDAFWRNLEADRDLISEIPADRWDWRRYYGDPLQEPGKTLVKSGGFITDVDRFDPLFFGISPVEAEAMDPQFRLFLQTVWCTIEDAGYRSAALAGKKVGVFVGVSSADYRELSRQTQAEGFMTTFPFAVANRLSYILNLNGPSEAIDTACSSSLIAMHRAVESIRSGSSEMALVGGVNVMASPQLFIAASGAGMLSEDGRSKTFDKRADGYGRGEGVGAVFLKSLDQARADGDQIYGLVQGSAENHGGKATSPTAPNPLAQQDLLISAYKAANIDPATIGYIETHGTGTQLGDPIEINGLKAAFSELGANPAEPHCALGSVKANIGHLEAAAGISGIIKVLLMLKHGKITGNPHLKDPNPYLKLEGSPFYLAEKTHDWKPATNTSGVSSPRRAGVSSFGIGGANAHVVLEEYIAPHRQRPVAEGKPQMIVLSAKTPDRLAAQVANLRDYLAAHGDIALEDLAFTLQVGRDAMDHRLAFTATSIAEVQELLQAFLDDRSDGPSFHRGEVGVDDALRLFTEDEDMGDIVAAWIAKQKYDKFLELWVKGLAFDWDKLYANTQPMRLHLPTYPFLGERYWINTDQKSEEPAQTGFKKDHFEHILEQLEDGRIDVSQALQLTNASIS
jgi:polyketide synthase PksN